MKRYVIPLLAILLISTGFGYIGNHNFTNGYNFTNHNGTNMSNGYNGINTTNGTGWINKTTKGNTTIVMNKTKGEFNKTITTPGGVTINVQKSNGTIQVAINNTRIGNIIQIIKNREKRAYVFHLLKNKELNSTVRREIKEKIIVAMRNSTLRKEILQNRTILAEIVHPKVKPIVETGMIKNTTIIKNGNSTLISMKVVIHKKILGFWPVNMSENVLTNDTYYKIKKPWWSIFTI